MKKRRKKKLKNELKFRPQNSKKWLRPSNLNVIANLGLQERFLERHKLKSWLITLKIKFPSISLILKLFKQQQKNDFNITFDYFISFHSKATTKRKLFQVYFRLTNHIKKRVVYKYIQIPFKY